MSVALTEEAVRARRKTVTRRLNWWENKRGHRILDVGDKLTLCPKVQGRRRGDVVEPLDRIVEVTVTSIRRERLDAITADDILCEGFELPGSPAASVAWFVEYFCDEMGCTPDTIVTRIEWAYPTPMVADPVVLSLFESQHAGPHSLQHIRQVDVTGVHLGGGFTAQVLCGRHITGWDIEDPVTPATIAASTGGVIAPMCPRCGELATSVLRAPSDPNAGVPDAPVVASAPVHLRTDRR